MKRINDIFYSLQGEGRNTGRASVFVRFAGCNLRCPFCDTEFETYREMTDEDIITAIQALCPSPVLVVLTGGEPTLQVDEAFVSLLHRHGFEVAMESNGTRPAPRNLDWLTVSPKGRQAVQTPNELKVIFDENTDPDAFLPSVSPMPELYLQPCDTGDAERNACIIDKCVTYIKTHPQWRLSLQTHKLAGFK